MKNGPELRKLKFSCSDIENRFYKSLGVVVISNILNSLGQVGLIDYYSPKRDISGKPTKGWAEYKLSDDGKFFIEECRDFIYDSIKKKIGVLNEVKK